jgi:AcrR family transcriptional regulator
MAARKPAASAKPKSAPSPSGARANKAAAGSLNGGRARDREVIEAAVRIFWEKGYANASVQDVADALGMLKGSLYYYIDSKERLLEKIFEDSHEDLTKLAEVAIASEGNAVDRLSRFLEDYAMWTLTHVERAGLYAREWRYASDSLRASLGEQQRFYDRSLRALISAGQEEGLIDGSIKPRAVSLFVWAAFTGLPDWYRPTTKADAKAIAATYVELGRRACGVRPGSAPAAAVAGQRNGNG